jgi:hypothetical protein
MAAAVVDFDLWGIVSNKGLLVNLRNELAAIAEATEHKLVNSFPCLGDLGVGPPATDILGRNRVEFPRLRISNIVPVDECDPFRPRRPINREDQAGAQGISRTFIREGCLFFQFLLRELGPLLNCFQVRGWVFLFRKSTIPLRRIRVSVNVWRAWLLPTVVCQGPGNPVILFYERLGRYFT